MWFLLWLMGYLEIYFSKFWRFPKFLLLIFKLALSWLKNVFCMFFCPICIECSSRVLLYLFRAFSRETKPTEAGCWKTWEPLSTCLCIEKDGTVLSMLIEQTSLLLMSSICSYLGTSRDWNGQKRDVLGEMQWNDGRLFLLPC